MFRFGEWGGVFGVEEGKVFEEEESDVLVGVEFIFGESFGRVSGSG